MRIHRAQVRLKETLARDCEFNYEREQTLRCDRMPWEGST
jgi:hypothetical protein